jgi:hypothetical protein
LVADLFLVNSANCVILTLNWDGNVDNILDNLLNDLLNWVWLVDVGDVFNWHSNDLNLRHGDIIRGGVGAFDHFVDCVGNWSVDNFLDCVWNSDLNGNGNVDGLGNWDVLGDDFLHDLFHWVWNGSVDESLHWDWDRNWNADFDWAGNVDNLLNDLLNWVGDLAFNNPFDWVWNGLFDDLLDWDWDLHSLTDFIGDLDGVGSIHSLLIGDGDGDLFRDGVGSGNWGHLVH